MMKRINLLLITAGWGILMVLSCCGRNPETQSYEKLFDLGSLIDSQVIYLSVNHYGIRKISSLGFQEEVTENYPDSSGWEKELSIIKTADLSKPGLRPYYMVKTYEKALFLVDEYFVTDSGSLPTIYQKIVRDKDSGQLARIEAQQRVNNPIYHSNRHIEIVFNQGDAYKLIIDSILVKGYQKIISQDTVFYTTIAKVIP